MSAPAASRKVAVVIGSGSVKCAAAVGMLSVLEREGIGVDLLVGTSGGSLYAALIAMGIDAKTCGDMARRLWTRDLTRQGNRRDLLAALFPRLMGFSAEFGLRSDRPVMRRLRQVYGDRKLEETRIPLFLTATDFENGDQVVLSEGSLVEAIRASIAIPFVFRPRRVGGRLLVDGFLSDPLPVGVAVREGAGVILAMGFESPYQSRIPSAARFAFQVSSIMTNNLLRSNFAFHNLAHHAEVLPIVPEFAERVRLFDTEKIPYVIEEGARATEEQIPYLRRLLAAEAAG